MSEYPYGSGPATEPIQPHVITRPRPWYRKLRFMLPITALAAFTLGTAAPGDNNKPTGVAASVAAPVSTVTRTGTATVTERAAPAPAKTVTRTVAAADSRAVRRVLAAWTDAGPKPDQQATAMRDLRAQWPSLAKALEAATGVHAPAAPRTAPPPPVRAAPPVPTDTAPAGVFYANCSEARAAGDTPLYVGQPGYRATLDRDGDGVACE